MVKKEIAEIKEIKEIRVNVVRKEIEGTQQTSLL